MTLPADTLPALALWLAAPGRLEQMRHHDLALSFHDEIKATVERCRQAIDRPQSREVQVPAGTHENCGGQVTGHLPPEDEGEVVLRCDCGKAWTPTEFRGAARHLRQDETLRPVWVSTAQAATMLGVKDSTVRDYVRRNRLRCEVRARGQRRVLMVHQGDVIQIRDAKQTA